MADSTDKTNKTNKTGDDKRPFFSIVMPCYGVGEYIACAIECIQVQTFSDWELIVVDDCTPDASARIAADYASLDERICVVSHRENKGLSAARNTGISVSRGHYLWMPDPDDTYDAHLLQRVYEVLCTKELHQGQTAVENEAAEYSIDNGAEVDVVLFGHTEEYYDAAGAFLYEHELPMEEGRYGNTREWHPLVIDFEQGTHFGYVWNKVYRLERVKQLGLQFEHVRLIEDIAFNAGFFKDAQAVCVLGGVLYRYAKRQGKSLTNANAYSADEYYALHRRRIALLHDVLAGWGVLDERTQRMLGALYGRYILSTLERQCSPSESLTRAQRRAWCEKVFRDPLYIELIPVAQAKGVALKMCLLPLRVRAVGACLALGRVLYFAREHTYTLFTRARSGR